MELWWLDNVTSKSSGLQIKFPVLVRCNSTRDFMEASELPKILYLCIIPLACPPEVEDNNRLLMEPREGYTTDTFLNQYNLKVHSKYLSLVPQKYVVLIIHQRRLFLQEMDTVTESHN